MAWWNLGAKKRPLAARRDRRDDVVAPARDRIRAGELTKAVLARELVLEASGPIDQRAVVGRLLRSHPSATVFALDGFVGASPETLVSRVDDVVRAHPLAGTTPRATDPAGQRRDGDRRAGAVVGPDRRSPGAQTPGKPTVRKNQREEVSQIATSTVTRAAPARGRAHSGIRRLWRTSIFVVKTP